MATSDCKGKIVHREVFQNANQMVEVLIRTKPKSSQKEQLRSKSKPFVRDCILKKSLDKISEETGNIPEISRDAKKNKGYQTKQQSKHDKLSQRMTIEVSKSKNKFKKNVSAHSANTTWGDFLKNCSSIGGNDSSSSKISEESDNVLKNKDQDQLDDVESRYKNLSLKPTQLEKLETTSKSREVSQIQNHHALNKDLKKAQYNEQNIGAFMARKEFKQLNSKDAEVINCKNINSNAHTVHEREIPQLDRIDNAETPQSNKDRLNSDGLSNTPFSDSALKLLKQLRVKLSKRGDSESSEALGLLEQYFTGGLQTPQQQPYADNNTPMSSVFITPHGELPTNYHPPSPIPPSTSTVQRNVNPLQSEISDLRAENAFQATTINELRTLSARLLAQHQRQEVAPNPVNEKSHSTHNNIHDAPTVPIGSVKNDLHNVKLDGKQIKLNSDEIPIPDNLEDIVPLKNNNKHKIQKNDKIRQPVISDLPGINHRTNNKLCNDNNLPQDGGRIKNHAPQINISTDDVPAPAFTNTALSSDRELRAALLKAQVDNELLRRRLVEAQRIERQPAQASSQLPVTRPSQQRPDNSDGDSAFDEKFSSRFTSKRPSPASTSGINSTSPPVVAPNELRESELPNIQNQFKGTASTQIDLEMFAATDTQQNHVPPQIQTMQNSITLRPNCAELNTLNDSGSKQHKLRSDKRDASLQDRLVNYKPTERRFSPDDSTINEEYNFSNLSVSDVDTDHSNTSSRSFRQRKLTTMQLSKFLGNDLTNIKSAGELIQSKRTCNKNSYFRPFSLNSSSINDCSKLEDGSSSRSGSSMETGTRQRFESTRMNEGSNAPSRESPDTMQHQSNHSTVYTALGAEIDDESTI